MIPIVNEQDEIIGYKERGTCSEGDINRASGLWIENSKGEVLIIKRSDKVTFAPTTYSVLTGTVDEGETYESNVVKEAAEELGVIISEQDLLRAEKILYSNKDNPHKNRYFVQWYKIVKDIDVDTLTLDPAEVAGVKWFPKEELKNLYNEHPEQFFVHFRQNLEMFGII